ncbi:uncharacterized protein LOC122264428 [Penaeus japonicus]|uniref:uncharacterized protein LOC122264428 n=1 Tax=Penaeus japonicus TaxID=27405 RepID=UPI001C714FBA|nr:uncharacterized protein LOC122264428 [Penaeus japonicus]
MQEGEEGVGGGSKEELVVGGQEVGEEERHPEGILHISDLKPRREESLSFTPLTSHSTQDPGADSNLAAMANLGSQFKGAASCLVLYLLVVIVFYNPPSSSSHSREKSSGNGEGLEELFMSVARQGGISAGWQQGQGTGVALSKEDPSRGSSSQQCQAMFTVEKDGQLWVDDGPYTELSNQLPSLLVGLTHENSSASASVYPSTRLSLVNGSVPYIPCKIRQYDLPDLGSCSAARSAQGKKTWIAFVGDSNGRQKVHTFVYFLPPDLEYTFFLGEQQVTREAFLAAVAHHHHRPLSFDILGRRREEGHQAAHEEGGPKVSENPLPSSPDQDIFSFYEEPYDHTTFNSTMFPLHDSNVPLESYELRVTLVWAPLASVVSSPLSREKMKIDKLKEWQKQEVIPDAIVVGFGTWMMLMKNTGDELVPYTEAEYRARPLVSQLTHLAARTTVLWWHQSRYRWFSFEDEIAGEEMKMMLWHKKVHMSQFSDGIPFMDAWLWQTSLRDTGMWQWDSTVPFNLANLQECRSLRSSGLAEQSIYHGKWWNCQDVHHSSYETNADEIQMLLNLLCNPYLAPDSQYCCSSV